MTANSIESILSFSEKEKVLHVDTRSFVSETIDITVLNNRAETINRMKLISGEHFISLASMPAGEYSVRLVSGNNVWVNKIFLQQQ